MVKNRRHKFADMKKLAILPLLATIGAPLTATAQRQTHETADTIAAGTLGEITVVAANQRTESARTVYIPDQRQRAAASDGISLLARMNIVQLNVNPLSETVKTASNQEASLFIDFQAASREDVAALDPSTVKRVEYLESPSDPRFLRAHHVVNFITARLPYGGYTKLIARARFLTHAGNTSAYSRFSRGEMDYDLMLSGQYDHNPHIGSILSETYRLPSATVSRTAATVDATHREKHLFAGVRASWRKGDRFSWRNLISLTHKGSPENSSTGVVSMPALQQSEGFTTHSSSVSHAISWESDLYATLPCGWSVNGSAKVKHHANSTANSYMNILCEINNNADETAWGMQADMQINKALSEKITVFTSLKGIDWRTTIHYSGTSSATNIFRQAVAGLYVGISAKTGKLSGSIDGGYALESNIINSQPNNNRYPFTHISLQYAPTQRHSLNLWCQYATMSPDAAMKNPNIIQQSEMLYISGNPDLECARNFTTAINGSWFPDNRWQLSAYAILFRITNRQIAVYTPDAPNGTMLKKYQNNGNYNHGQLGASLSAKFLDGKLALSLSPRLLLYKTTGSNSISHYPFTTSATVGYYPGRFFIDAYYTSQSSYVDGETCFLRRMPSEYSLGAGWADKGWNIRLTAANLFRSSWILSNDTLDTQWFASTAAILGSDFHRCISLSITYTFSYGRKPGQTDELHSVDGITSSILR